MVGSMCCKEEEGLILDLIKAIIINSFNKKKSTMTCKGITEAVKTVNDSNYPCNGSFRFLEI